MARPLTPLPRRRGPGRLLPALLPLLPLVLPLLLPPGPAASGAPPGDVAALLEKHCLECHGPRKAKGDLRLDLLGTDFDDPATRRRWEVVAEQVERGDMPPEDRPRPGPAASGALGDWVAASVGAALGRERSREGRVVLRRLNRVEYENTLRDLLGVPVSVRDLLPLDTPAAGFDNVGEALHTSSFLLDRYLEAAETALAQAIANRPRPASPLVRHFLTDSHQVKSTGEKVFLREAGGAVTAFSSSAWQAMGLTKFYPQERGAYRFRISASAVRHGDRPLPFRVWAGQGGMGGAKGHLVSYFDAPPGTPRVFEFVEHLEARTSISILPYGLPSAQTVHRIGAEAYDGPGLRIDWIEVEGPLHDRWPPESHRRLLGDLPQVPVSRPGGAARLEVVSQDPRQDAVRILSRFARSAFRRPVTDEDLAPYLALCETRRAETGSFEKGLRAALAAVLVSPEFLFLHESPGPLDDFALASRLSYFLWSSLPDEPLLEAAAAGRLRDPEARAAQVERLLKDPRSAAFVEHFTGQWLGLRDLDATLPSHLLYPEFDDMLKASMAAEARHLFRELLDTDAPLTDFLDGDYAMLNGRLARHYGIPGVEGWEFRRVALPPDSPRGGVLTMAGVLKVTANGTTTSPVIRGAWVMDRILGEPAPPPPANIPPLEPDTRGAATIRERLDRHREIASCHRCHAAIDPPGFALESFDVIGGWRDRYRVTGSGEPVILDGKRQPYLLGPAVDPSGELPDGRSFRDIAEFKRLLLADPDAFARALTVKLVTYATGAPPASIDREAIEAVVARNRARSRGFRSLVHEIVRSPLFLEK